MPVQATNQTKVLGLSTDILCTFQCLKILRFNHINISLLQFKVPSDWIVQGSHWDWKTWKNGEDIFQSSEFLTDWKSPVISYKILGNLGNFRKMLFIILVIFIWTVYCLLKSIECSVQKKNTTKILGKWKKWKGQGILSVRKSGNHIVEWEVPF